MSYGKTRGEKKQENTFIAGINDCRMTTFQIDMMEGEKYTGPTLLVTWTKEDGSQTNMRKFPVNEARIRDQYRANPAAPQYQVYDPATKTKVQGSEQEIVDREYATLNDVIEHIITAYVPEDVYNQAIANLPENTTFGMFINVLRELLPPTFAAVPGKLRAGYKKNSTFISVPDAMYMGGSFWTVNEDARKLTLKENKYFKYNAPWGEKIEQEQNAPSQETGETRF